MINRLKILLIAIVLGLCARAQGDSIRVSYVVFGPGAEIYQLEGHAALRLQIPGQQDLAINYGVFDFDSPGFVYRFVKGETDYLMDIEPWDRLVEAYRMHGRTITEFPVVMDSVQTDRLIRLLVDNARPENRVYRYNYVKDNCATRPLRMLELAIGEQITLPLVEGDCDTYRNTMRYYHSNYPWYQLGIDLALGYGIDYKITGREQAFAPALLAWQLNHAHIAGRRLSTGAIDLNPGAKDPILGPTPWYLTPDAIFWLLFAILVGITVRDILRRRTTRWVDTVLYTLFGIVGCVLTFLIFVSVHEATSPNLLYLWLNPAALLVPVFIWLKKCNKVVFWYQIVNFALILLMVALWKWMPQSGNTAFIPLILVDLMRSASYIYLNR